MCLPPDINAPRSAGRLAARVASQSAPFLHGSASAASSTRQFRYASVTKSHKAQHLPRAPAILDAVGGKPSSSGPSQPPNPVNYIDNASIIASSTVPPFCFQDANPALLDAVLPALCPIPAETLPSLCEIGQDPHNDMPTVLQAAASRSLWPQTSTTTTVAHDIIGEDSVIYRENSRMNGFDLSSMVPIMNGAGRRARIATSNKAVTSQLQGGSHSPRAVTTGKDVHALLNGDESDTHTAEDVSRFSGGGMFGTVSQQQAMTPVAHAAEEHKGSLAGVSGSCLEALQELHFLQKIELERKQQEQQLLLLSHLSKGMRGEHVGSLMMNELGWNGNDSVIGDQPVLPTDPLAGEFQGTAGKFFSPVGGSSIRTLENMNGQETAWAKQEVAGGSLESWLRCTMLRAGGKEAGKGNTAHEVMTQATPGLDVNHAFPADSFLGIKKASWGMKQTCIEAARVFGKVAILEDGEQYITDEEEERKERRMLSNRASAKRSRQKRMERLEQLEKSTALLQVEHASAIRHLLQAQKEMERLAEMNEKLKCDISELKNLAGKKRQQASAFPTQEGLGKQAAGISRQEEQMTVQTSKRLKRDFNDHNQEADGVDTVQPVQGISYANKREYGCATGNGNGESVHTNGSVVDHCSGRDQCSGQDQTSKMRIVEDTPQSPFFSLSGFQGFGDDGLLDGLLECF